MWQARSPLRRPSRLPIAERTLAPPLRITVLLSGLAFRPIDDAFRAFAPLDPFEALRRLGPFLVGFRPPARPVVAALVPGQGATGGVLTPGGAVADFHANPVAGQVDAADLHPGEAVGGEEAGQGRLVGNRDITQAGPQL